MSKLRDLMNKAAVEKQPPKQYQVFSVVDEKTGKTIDAVVPLSRADAFEAEVKATDEELGVIARRHGGVCSG